ncbi:MAG: LOG family protein [Ardenticatenaceae bacterium]|nr:LOG family protein [Ardenticatenaceae bacterium]
MKRIITVFGSSRPLPDSAAYNEALTVGRLLAEAGYAVATGGYMGTMEAVSRGAAEAGGHVIGVTSAQIETFRPIPPNRWVKEEIRKELLRDRVTHLVMENDGMIVLPGGIGTLSEMALAWSLMQVGDIPPRPLVLYGPTWRATLTTFFDADYIRAQDYSLLQFADTPETAVALVTR